MLAAAVAFGVAAGTLCNFATGIKYIFRCDEALDVRTILYSFLEIILTISQIFATHAIGGVVGNIFTGFFAQKSVAAFDGSTEIPGGWMDHHWPQVGFQLANSMAGISYSFVVTVRNLVL